MEKYIQAKISAHNDGFKSSIQEWFKQHDARIIIGDKDTTNEFITFMLDHPNLFIEKEEFKQRKRIKNTEIPSPDRCIAIKCDGTRCTRRYKDDKLRLCGTHIKDANVTTESVLSTPIKTINTDEIVSTPPTQPNTNDDITLKVWLKDIQGIPRYVDANENVYKTSDIRNEVSPPTIMGTYTTEIINGEQVCKFVPN